jgi:uncharacterized membrane-anchored protein
MRQWHVGIARVAAATGLACAVGAAIAAPTQAEQTRVWDDVGRAAVKGPADVPLLDEAVLHVPAGEIFVPQPQADRLLTLFGNPGNNPDMPGLILPRDPRATWFMPVRFQAVGYIKDDDARTWNADEMLQSLKAGTDEQNREREKAGMPTMHVVGWTEPPHYDAATHRLAWALASRPVGAKDDDPPLVNYDTYALGRNGYFTMNMVTTLAELPALKPVAQRQVEALEYQPGKRYTDFDARTDRVAAYGLSSLVVGITQPGTDAASATHVSPRQLATYLLAALALLIAAGVFILRRRPRPAPAAPVPAPFVNTVADTPGPSASKVDLELDEDAAHADAGRRAT